MKGDFSRISFNEKKHYSDVLLQQGRVQLDADWNEAAAIEANRDERALQDVVGRCGSPNAGFQIAARMMLDPMESTAGWSATPPGAGVCLDYVDFLRGVGSLRVSGATEIHKDLAATLDLSGVGAVLCFAVKSAKAPPPVGGTQNDTGFTFYVADGTGKKASWAVSNLAPRVVGVWHVYTCSLTSPPANKDAGLSLRAITRVGFDNLRDDWTYHFDTIQRDFTPPSVPLQDILALDDLEDLRGWSVPPSGTGSVTLDGGTLFRGRPTVKITGPGDGLKSFAGPRDLRMYARVMTVTRQTANPDFYLAVASGTKKITLQNVVRSGTVGGWTTHVGDIPPDPDLDHIAGYGFEGVANNASLNVAQVLVLLTATGNFYILDGDASGPGRLYVGGIACQKEATETYYSQRAYPEALPLEPDNGRVDLVYLDVWERHVTYVEDPELREVALGGPDTCTRLQTIAQVKVLRGSIDQTNARLDCAAISGALRNRFAALIGTGRGTLSTLVAPPAPPDNLCQIAPDADYLGLDNRLYRVEIHDRGAVGAAGFKWSKDNGSLAVAVIEDVEANQTPQTIRVERLGRDKATTIGVDDWVEIADDLTDLADSGRDSNGLPVRMTGELAQVKEVDPDTNTITLKAPLARGYTVARHAKVRRWDGAGAPTAVFVDATTTPQLDFGDGVRVTFDGGSQPMLTGDYWQFTARGITGQIEKLDHALPAGVVHHYCPLALIKWGANGEIVDIADCRNHFPALTDIQATDVAYDDGCCGLTEDVKTLATWHGDVVDDPVTGTLVEGKVANVQQALDILCAREHEYLVLRYVSGDGQEGLPRETLPAPLIVAVENVLGEPQAGVEVEFKVLTTADDPKVAGVGSVTPVPPPPVRTDSNGEARVTWTLGATPGLNLVQASLNTPQTGTPEVIFNARALCADKICYQDTQCNLTADFNLLGHAGAVDTVQEALDTLCERESRFLVLRYVSGDGQEGPLDDPAGLPAALRVAVENLLGEPQPTQDVTFSIVPKDQLGAQTAGGVRAHTDPPSGSFVTSVTIPTGGDGIAACDWRLGPAEGLNLVRASLDTLQELPPHTHTPRTMEIIFNARTLGNDLRFHNKHLHGWGIVCGLQVACGPDRQHVTVKNGYAIDCEGNDVILRQSLSVDVLDEIGKLVQADPNQPILKNGDGEVCLTLGLDGNRQPTIGVEPYDPKKSTLQSRLQGTLLMDFIEDCVQTLWETLEEFLSPTPDAKGVSPSRKQFIALLNLLWQFVDPTHGRHVFLSQREHDLLRELYGVVRGLLQSQTFCAMFDDARPFPEYPFKDHGISTVFGKGNHHRLRIHPSGKLGYTVGMDHTIHVYDLSLEELVAEVEFPGGSDAVVRDVAFSPDGKELYAVATLQRGTASDTRFGVAQIGIPQHTWSPITVIPNVELVTLATVKTKELANLVYAVGLGQGLYRFDPGNVPPDATPLFAFPAVGHLAILEQKNQVWAYASARETAGQADRYSKVLVFELLKETSVGELPLTEPGTGQALSGQDDIAVASTKDTSWLFVVVEAGGGKQLLRFDARKPAPSTAMVDLAETSDIRLAQVPNSPYLLVSCEDTYRFKLVETSKPFLLPEYHFPVQVLPLSIAMEPQAGEKGKVYALNFLSNTITSIPAAHLNPPENEKVQPAPGSQQFLDELEEYRNDVVASFLDLVGGLLQYLKDCLCDHLLVNCPECGAEDKIYLACVSIREDSVYKVCNFSQRKYVKSFPMVEYWLSLVPVILLVSWGVEQFCCWILPDVFRRLQAPKVGAYGTLFKGYQIRQGLNRYREFSPLKGRSAQFATARGLVGDWIVSRLAKPIARGVPQENVVGSRVEDVRRSLEEAKVEVVGVEGYDPTQGTTNLRALAQAPIELQPGARVKLIEQDGVVRYYTLTEAEPESVKILRAEVASLKEFKGRFDAQKSLLDETARLQGEVSSLRSELSQLQQVNRETLAARDQEVREFKERLATLGDRLAELGPLKGGVERPGKARRPRKPGKQ